jgi:hypothetical protein
MIVRLPPEATFGHARLRQAHPRQWFIPAAQIAAKTMVLSGGPK